MKTLHMGAYLLLWVGGINWGLVGLFDLDLVNTIFGSMPMVAQLIYVLVGASAIFSLATHMSDCKVCSTGKKK